MPELPRSARLVAWGNLALSGAASLDEATDRIVAGDPAHRVTGLPGEPDAVGISLTLGRLRADGVIALRLVLPVPGDPTGLPGPPAVNGIAVEAGEAAVTVGGPPLALVPAGRGQWRVYDVAPATPSLPSMGEAERMMTEELRECAEDLARLDVARWGPAAATLLADRSRTTTVVLPQAYPARAHALLAQALRIGAVAALARQDEGGAVSAGEIGQRAAVLDRLATASRRAVEAACNTPLG